MQVNRCVHLVLAASLVAALGACGGDDAADQVPASGSEPDLVVADPVVTDPIVTDPIVTDPIVTDPIVTVAPAGVVVPVIALDNSFRPEQITIQVGDEVLWENRGRTEHNILNIESADEGFEADGAWGVDVEAFQPGDVFSHVFTEPGIFRYYCTIHGDIEVGMVGTIIVED